MITSWTPIVLHHLGDDVAGVPVIHPVDVLIVVDEPGDEGVAIGVLDDHDGTAVGDGLVVGHGKRPVRTEGGVELTLGIIGHVVDDRPLDGRAVGVGHGAGVGALGDVGHHGIRVGRQGGPAVLLHTTD